MECAEALSQHLSILFRFIFSKIDNLCQKNEPPIKLEVGIPIFELKFFSNGKTLSTIQIFSRFGEDVHPYFGIPQVGLEESPFRVSTDSGGDLHQQGHSRDEGADCGGIETIESRGQSS